MHIATGNIGQVTHVPQSSVLATAVALIIDKAKMLVRETSKGTFELPGLKVASNDNALQNLETLVHKLDVGEQPQQTLYLSQFPIDESRKKSVPVIVRIIHVNTTEVPSFLEGTFHPLSKLRGHTHASALTQAVAQWLSK